MLVPFAETRDTIASVRRDISALRSPSSLRRLSASSSRPPPRRISDQRQHLGAVIEERTRRLQFGDGFPILSLLSVDAPAEEVSATKVRVQFERFPACLHGRVVLARKEQDSRHLNGHAEGKRIKSLPSSDLCDGFFPSSHRHQAGSVVLRRPGVIRVELNGALEFCLRPPVQSYSTFHVPRAVALKP